MFWNDQWKNQLPPAGLREVWKCEGCPPAQAEAQTSWGCICSPLHGVDLSWVTLARAGPWLVSTGSNPLARQ